MQEDSGEITNRNYETISNRMVLTEEDFDRIWRIIARHTQLKFEVINKNAVELRAKVLKK